MEKQGDLEGDIVECHKPQKEHTHTQILHEHGGVMI